MVRKLMPYVGVVLAVCFFAGAAYAMGDPGVDHAGQKKSWFDLFRSPGFVGSLLVGTSKFVTALLIQFMVTMSGSSWRTTRSWRKSNLLSRARWTRRTRSPPRTKLLEPADRGRARAVSAASRRRRAWSTRRRRCSASLEDQLPFSSSAVGPLLGLLGTVTGMIASFQTIETLKSPTPGDMAHGVYESLVNTTIGLFIAVVFLTAYFFMKNKISDLTLRINNAVGEMLARTMSPEAQQGAAK
jgi:biopolymer transport protein ExbB/TolQ